MMNNKTKKLILIIVACILAVAIIVLSAVLIIKNLGPCMLNIESKTALAGDDVSLSVSIDKNPGLYIGVMSVKYDTSALTFVSCGNGDVFDEREINSLDGEVVILVSQSGLKDTDKDGVIVNLNFTVKENASKGEYDIRFDFSDREMTGFRNVKDPETYIDFEFQHGKITVK